MNTHTSNLRKKVKATQVFTNLNTFHKEIVNTRQNLKAIGKSLLVIEKEGIKNWEERTQNSYNNAEIIREIYAKHLEVKLN